MKKLITLSLLLTIFGLSNSFAQGTWSQKANFGGTARSYAVGFSIGAKGYIGTGNDSITPNQQHFWEWDQAANV